MRSLLHFFRLFLKRVVLRTERLCFADFRAPQQETIALTPETSRPAFSSEQLRICLFIENLGSGGAERQLVFLARGLAARGHAVEVLCFTRENANAQYLALLEKASVPLRVVDRFSLIRNRSRCLRVLKSIQGLRLLPAWLRPSSLAVLAFLLEHDFHILHTYLDGPNCMGGVAGLLAGIPVIRLSARSLSPAHPSNQAMSPYAASFRMCYRALLGMPNISLEANSQAGAKDYARWLGLPESSVAVTHNGIPHDFLELSVPVDGRTNPPLIHPNGEPTLLCIQRMSEEKRPTLPIHVLTRVREKLPKARLLYVGAGPLWDEVQACVTHLHQESAVTLLGTRSDIPLIVRSAQLFLLTSRREGFPNVLMEAMLAGLPSVAVNVGGVAELVEQGVHGMLVENPEEDSPQAFSMLAQSMADAVVGLWRTQARAKTMGDAARARIEQKFSVERLAKQAEQAYYRIASHGTSA
jgi:Glycosyltransferase